MKWRKRMLAVVIALALPVGLSFVWTWLLPPDLAAGVSFLVGVPCGSVGVLLWIDTT